MDVWEVPQSSRSGLDRGFLMDVGPKRAALGAWHHVVVRPSSLGNPSEWIVVCPLVSVIQRLCRWGLRDALAGDPPALGEDRPMAHREGTQDHVAVGDFKTFIANSESKSSGIATRMGIEVAE